jgi:hypothetical protein
MFARYFIELPVPAGSVERMLMQDPGSWLPGLAGFANERGDRLLAEVGFGERLRIARPVTIELGPVVHFEAKTILPLRWIPAGSGGLFPTLDADVEVAPLGAERTQLAMSARYTPPLRAIGRLVDRALMFRVAEATLKDFLDRVGRELMLTYEAGAVAERPVSIAIDGS